MLAEMFAPPPLHPVVRESLIGAVMLALYAAYFITDNGWYGAIAGVMTVVSIARLKVEPDASDNASR